MKLVIRMWHCNPVLVTAVVLLMVVSTNAQLTIVVTRRSISSNNDIRLTCRDYDGTYGTETRATFYRRVPHDGRELLINPNEAYNVEFVITSDTEGSYFCNNYIGRSNIQEINGKNIY